MKSKAQKFTNQINSRNAARLFIKKSDNNREEASYTINLMTEQRKSTVTKTRCELIRDQEPYVSVSILKIIAHSPISTVAQSMGLLKGKSGLLFNTKLPN